MCESTEVDNVWTFKYLVSRFRADGDQTCDIKARITAATTTFDKMRNIWSARSTPLRLKLRFYTTGVCSKLSYGSEDWRLDERTITMLNGANSRMMARITGRTVHEESDAEKTFDLVAKL